MPSLAVPVIFLIPVIPETASSIGNKIDSSISSGVAPEYGTATIIKSRSNSGNTSCLILETPITPATKIMIISKFAATLCSAIQRIMTPPYLIQKFIFFGYSLVFPISHTLVHLFHLLVSFALSFLLKTASFFLPHFFCFFFPGNADFKPICSTFDGRNDNLFSLLYAT